MPAVAGVSAAICGGWLLRPPWAVALEPMLPGRPAAKLVLPLVRGATAPGLLRLGHQACAAQVTPLAPCAVSRPQPQSHDLPAGQHGLTSISS